MCPDNHNRCRLQEKRNACFIKYVLINDTAKNNFVLKLINISIYNNVEKVCDLRFSFINHISLSDTFIILLLLIFSSCNIIVIFLSDYFL